MKTWIFIILSTVSVSFTYGQTDTIYVKFEKAVFNRISEHMFIDKKGDFDTSSFPSDKSRSYYYNKKDGNFTEFISFFYMRFVPEWSSTPFRYMRVTKKQLGKISFIDNAWFIDHTYDEIIRYFTGDKIIYIYDTLQPRKKKRYLVRVYFHFISEE